MMEKRKFSRGDSERGSCFQVEDTSNCYQKQALGPKGIPIQYPRVLKEIP